MTLLMHYSVFARRQTLSSLPGNCHQAAIILGAFDVLSGADSQLFVGQLCVCREKLLHLIEYCLYIRFVLGRCHALKAIDG